MFPKIFSPIFLVFGVRECYNDAGATIKATCLPSNNGTCFTKMIYINESTQATEIERGCRTIDVCKNNCTVVMTGAESTRTCEDCCYENMCNNKGNLYDGKISSSSHIAISILTVLGFASIAHIIHSWTKWSRITNFKHTLNIQTYQHFWKYQGELTRPIISSMVKLVRDVISTLYSRIIWLS